MNGREEKNNYLNLMSSLDKLVDDEASVFNALSPKRKIEYIARCVKKYCEKNNSANRYKILEQSNPKYEKLRQEAEYVELLSCIRVKKSIKLLDGDELNMYVLHLREKLQEGLIEKDTKKRFEIHDYINYGCLFAKVDNDKIKGEIEKIKEEAYQIIRDIPSM